MRGRQARLRSTWFVSACCATAIAGCSNPSSPACAPPENVDGGLPYSPAELPSGACGTAQTCAYVIDRCDAGTFPTAADEWTCTCDGGKWACTLTLAGKGVCATSDAAAD